MDSSVAVLCIVLHARFESLERSYAGLERGFTWYHEFATLVWKGEEKKTTSDLCSNVGKAISSIKVILIVITVMLKLTTDRIRFSYLSCCYLSNRNLTWTLQKRKWTGQKFLSKQEKLNKIWQRGKRKRPRRSKKPLVLFSTLCVLFPLVYFSSSRGQTAWEGVDGGRWPCGSERASATFARACAVPRLCARRVWCGGESRGGGGEERVEEADERNKEKLEESRKKKRGDMALL